MISLDALRCAAERLIDEDDDMLIRPDQCLTLVRIAEAAQAWRDHDSPAHRKELCDALKEIEG